MLTIITDYGILLLFEDTGSEDVQDHHEEGEETERSVCVSDFKMLVGVVCVPRLPGTCSVFETSHHA